MKRAIIVVILAFIIFSSSASFAGSEFQQRQLLNRYLSVSESDWETLTKANKTLIDDNLYDMVKIMYQKAVLAATEKAETAGKKRKIESGVFVYANLGDYIARQMNKKSDLRYNLAKEQLKDGRTDIAADICNHISLTDRKSAEVSILKAELFLRMNMANEAYETYKYVLTIDKNSEIANYRLAVLSSSLGKYDDAAKYYREALRLNPKNEEAKKFLDLYDGKTKNSPVKKVNEVATGHFMSAEKLFAAGKYSEAADFYTQALEADPQFYKAYVYLGECLSRLKKYDEAEQVLDQALKLNPKDPEAYHFLGLTFEKHYNFSHDREFLKKAIKNYEKAIATRPSYREVQEDLARAKKRLAGADKPDKNQN